MQPETLKAVERALVELTQWLGRALQYSPDHPAIADFGRGVHERMRDALSLSGPLDVGVLKDALVVAEQPLTAPLLKSRTAPYLHERGALLVRISPGVTFEDLSAFVAILMMPPHDVFDGGGLRVMLARRGVSQITIDEIAHEITTEEIAEERRRQKLRELFKDTINALLQGRSLEDLDYQHVLELLRNPDVAARIIEGEGPESTAEALAGLALIALQEEIRSGQPMGAQVVKVLEELGTEARARVFEGFVQLAGTFREALGQIFDDMTESALAGFLFAALRARTGDLDAFFYLASQVAPDEPRRRAVLRWLGSRLFDLPFEEGRALGLLMLLSRDVSIDDPFVTDRDIVTRQAQHIARERLPLRARNVTVRLSDEPFAPDALERLDHRTAATLMSVGSRLVDFQPHVEKLPLLVEALSSSGRGGAVAGLFRGVVQVRDPRWKLIVDDAITKLAATTAAVEVARDIEKFAGMFKQQVDELAPMLQVVAQHHGPTLLELLEKSTHRDTRKLLLDVLPSAGMDLLPLVRQRLRSQDWFVVRNMVILLRRLGARSIELFPVAQHENASVRLEVLRALRGMSSDEHVTAMLIDFLSDEDAEIRGGAMLALGEATLSDADVQRLEATASDDKRSEEARRTVIRTLGRSSSNAAARALVRLLEPKGLIEGTVASNLRERAAVALRDSKAPEGRSLFEGALKSSSWRVRRACERAQEGHDG